MWIVVTKRYGNFTDLDYELNKIVKYDGCYWVFSTRDLISLNRRNIRLSVEIIKIINIVGKFFSYKHFLDNFQ
jgi:hypothetical protein